MKRERVATISDRTRHRPPLCGNMHGRSVKTAGTFGSMFFWNSESRLPLPLENETWKAPIQRRKPWAISRGGSGTSHCVPPRIRYVVVHLFTSTVPCASFSFATPSSRESSFCGKDTNRHANSIDYSDNSTGRGQRSKSKCWIIPVTMPGVRAGMDCTGTNSGPAEPTRGRDLFILVSVRVWIFHFPPSLPARAASLGGLLHTIRSGKAGKGGFSPTSRGRFHLLPSPRPLSSSPPAFPWLAH